LIENQDKTIGVSSGYPIYDTLIGGGFRRKGVSIICARLKSGKTTIGINISYNVAERGIKVLNGDTEMHKFDHVNKVMAIKSKLDIHMIERGKFAKNTNDNLKALEAVQAIKKLKGNYKHVSLSGKPIEEIISIFRRWVHKDVGKNENGVTNNCLIILDYLKLMDLSEMRSAKEHQILGYYMQCLNHFAIQMDVPILCLAQENRDGIKTTNSSTLAGSDRIGWFCQSLATLKKKTPDEINEFPGEGNRKLIPTDCRYGEGLESDNDYINFKFLKKKGIIKEGKTYSQLVNNKKGFEVENNGEAVEVF
jgi:replicative DNA helicase